MITKKTVTTLLMVVIMASGIASADGTNTYQFSDIFKLPDHCVFGYKSEWMATVGTYTDNYHSIETWDKLEDTTGLPAGATHTRTFLDYDYVMTEVYGVSDALRYYGFVTTGVEEGGSVVSVSELTSGPKIVIPATVTKGDSFTATSVSVTTDSDFDEPMSKQEETVTTLHSLYTAMTHAGIFQDCFFFQETKTIKDLNSDGSEEGVSSSTRIGRYFHPTFGWISESQVSTFPDFTTMSKKTLAGAVIDGKAYPEGGAIGLLKIEKNYTTGKRTVLISLFGDQVVDVYITLFGPKGKVAGLTMAGLSEGNVTAIAGGISLNDLIPFKPYNIKLLEFSIPVGWEAGQYYIDCTLTAHGDVNFETIFSEEVYPFAVSQSEITLQ